MSDGRGQGERRRESDNSDGFDAGRPRPARAEEYVRTNIDGADCAAGRAANTNSTEIRRPGRERRTGWVGRNMSGSRGTGRRKRNSGGRGTKCIIIHHAGDFPRDADSGGNDCGEPGEIGEI